MRALVLAAIAGCGFSPHEAQVDASLATRDAPGSLVHTDASASSPDAEPPAACYAPDITGIELCLELDDPDLTGSAIARDGAPGHHDATMTNGLPITRTVPTSSPAQEISTTSGASQVDIQVPDSTDFDLPAFTLMAWIDRTATPEDDMAYGIIERSNQFLMYIDDEGGIDCSIGSSGENGVLGDIVSLNTWSLIACTYDGSQVCALLMSGGSGTAEQECEDVGAVNVGSASNGPVIGARYSTSEGMFNHLYGSLDSARIFNRALSASEICVGGGRSGC
jgi:hypothetical protein